MNFDAAENRNIVLVGFMGTGKSVVGRILAQRLDLRFVDMDGLIEEREGREIKEIFASEGEGTFRALERNLVVELAGRRGLVIATGGGVVLDPRNVEDFEESALVVCLNASPASIFSRVAAASHRPLLEGGEKLARIESILAERSPCYSQVECQIDTDELEPTEVADIIAEMYIETR